MSAASLLGDETLIRPDNNSRLSLMVRDDGVDGIDGFPDILAQ